MALRKNLTASAERPSSPYATPRRQSASTFFGSNFKICEYRAAASVTAPRRCISRPSCSSRDASALVTLHLVRSTCAQSRLRPQGRYARPQPPKTGVTALKAGGGRRVNAAIARDGAVRVTRAHRSTRRRLHCAAMQVGLDQELRAATEPNAVDLEIFQHALD